MTKVFLCFAEKLRMAIAAAGPKSAGSGGLMKSKNSKPEEIRRSNIQAAKALSDAVRTSLGPRGMDKMIQVPVTELLPGVRYVHLQFGH
jgi:T-complex protein 1 subunit delta